MSKLKEKILKLELEKDLKELEYKTDKKISNLYTLYEDLLVKIDYLEEKIDNR